MSRRKPAAVAATAPAVEPAPARSPTPPTPPTPPPLSRRDTLIAALLAAGVFAIYAWGASRTIFVGDSGELVAAAHMLGIPHPSGYPLYVLLGKAFTLLVPVGSIAFRMSLFSAVAAAAACALLYRICREQGARPLAATTAALLLAWSPSLWGEANIQRVYALNTLFVVAAAGCALRWYRRRDEDTAARWLVAAALVCGLGAANHTFMAVMAIALGLFVLVTEPALVRRWKVIAAGAAAFAAGLLPYLYLPLRSRSDPPLDWGDPETWDGFVGVISRRDFWERAWLERPSDWLAIGGDYLQSLGAELWWGGAALALLAVAVGRRRGWPVLLPLLVMAVNLLVMGLHGSRSDIFIWHRYYIPSYAMAALLAGLGTEVLLAHLRRLPRLLHPLPLLLPLALLLTNWRDFDRSRYVIAEDFSRKLLAALPPGAHLAASDDNILFVLIYLHFVENVRPDLDLILQGVGDAALPPLRFKPESDPLFFTHHPNWQLPELAVVPIGLSFQVARADQTVEIPPLPAPLEGAVDSRVPKDYLTSNLIGQFHFMLGTTLEERNWVAAEREYQNATVAAPENDVLFYNLGLIYRRNGLFDEALEYFARSQQLNPRHIASQGDVRASDRIAETETEMARLRALESGLRTAPVVAGLPAGSPAWHLAMAELLESQGEAWAARGHRLRAARG